MAKSSKSGADKGGNVVRRVKAGAAGSSDNADKTVVKSNKTGKLAKSSSSLEKSVAKKVKKAEKKVKSTAVINPSKASLKHSLVAVVAALVAVACGYASTILVNAWQRTGLIAVAIIAIIVALAQLAKARATSGRPKKPVPKLLRPFAAVGRYFRDSWRELREIQWTNRRQTWSLTFAVIAFSAFFLLLVLAVDWVFQFLIQDVIL